MIFPVAGGAGLGAGAAAQAAGGKVNVLWVDTDGCVSAAQYCTVLHLQRHEEPGRRGADVRDGGGGAAPSRPATTSATCKNDGTGLAPFHQFDSKVPADLKAELDQVKADIVSGKITIKSPSQPTS